MRKLHVFTGFSIVFGILSFSITPVFAMLEDADIQKARRTLLRVADKEISEEQFKQKLNKISPAFITHAFLYGTLEEGPHHGKTLINLRSESKGAPLFMHRVLCEVFTNPRDLILGEALRDISIHQDDSHEVNWTSDHPLKISLQQLRGMDGYTIDGDLVLSIDTITIRTGFQFTMNQVAPFFHKILEHAFMERAFLQDDLLTSIPLTATIQTQPPKHLQDLRRNFLELQQSLNAAKEKIRELEDQVS